MNSYFVYHSEKFQGPFATEEIASLLRQNKISVQEFLYDLQFRCIFQIGEIEDFETFLPKNPPQMNPNEDYLIYKDNKIEGPYSKKQIVDQLRLQKLISFDYVTLWGGTSWAQLKNVPIFKDYVVSPPDEKFLNFEGTDNGVNKSNTIIREELMNDLSLTPGIIRRYPRTPYSASSTIIHNENSYVGKCTTLSVGGCFIQIKSAPFKTGDEILVIIKPDTIKISIEVKARITSMDQGNLKGVGLQFLNLSNELRMEIQKFVNRYVNMVKKRDS